jgi:tRNA-Thr(GGU) m(6)t(6)A37 methyltransferase TsaA
MLALHNGRNRLRTDSIGCIYTMFCQNVNLLRMGESDIKILGRHLWLNWTMEKITLTPLGHVYNIRKSLDDDGWGNVISEIKLDESLPADCLAGIEAFSHAEIIFYFNQVASENDIPMLRHPRGKKDWPQVGVFAQRNKDRPNHLGLTVVNIVRREKRSLFVKGLDAVHGTPILDIKPVYTEFLPREEIRQPEWSHELMKEYWN